MADTFYRLKRKRYSVGLALGPALLVYLAMLALPMLLLAQYSFFRKAPGEFQIIRVFTLDNYAGFLTDAFYLGVLRDTILTALGVTAMCLVLAYPVAYELSRARRHKALLYVAVLTPFFVSVVIRTYAWMLILSDNGLINWLLVSTGLASASVPLIFNRTGVVIGMTHIMLPYLILTLEAVLRQIDSSLVDAASSLGANPRQVFQRITFPLSLPGVVAGSMVVFSLSTSIFTLPALMGGGKVPMMSILVQQQALRLINWPFAAAIAWILLATALLIVGFYQRWLGSYHWRET